MVTCDLVSAGMVAVMAAGHAPVWALLALLVALGLIAPVQAGSRTALLAAILPGDTFVAGRSLFRVVSQVDSSGRQRHGRPATLRLPSPRGALAVDAGTFVPLSAVLVRVGTRGHGRRTRCLPTSCSHCSRDSLASVRSGALASTLRRVLLLGWLVPAFSVAPEALAAPGVRELRQRRGRGGDLARAPLPAGLIVGEINGAAGALARPRPPARRPRSCWIFPSLRRVRGRSGSV